MNDIRRQDLHAALLEILDEAMHVDRAARGKIRVYNPHTGRLEISVHRGFSDDFVAAFGAIERDTRLACARAFRLGRRVTVPDVSRDTLPDDYREAARQEGFQAVQSTPLISAGGKVLGTLTTHFEQVHLPSMSASLVLDYLSRKAAGVIECLADGEAAPS
jgi:GAF domain-containing protein